MTNLEMTLCCLALRRAAADSDALAKTLFKDSPEAVRIMAKSAVEHRALAAKLDAAIRCDECLLTPHELRNKLVAVERELSALKKLSNIDRGAHAGLDAENGRLRRALDEIAQLALLPAHPGKLVLDKCRAALTHPEPGHAAPVLFCEDSEPFKATGMLARVFVESDQVLGVNEFNLYTDDGAGNGSHLFSIPLEELERAVDAWRARRGV